MDYFRFGSGSDTLVILPGLSVQSVMGSSDAVAQAYALLAQDYTVYLFDRRRDVPADYTVAQMAEDTAEAMAALGLRQVCLFGVSQGGMLALQIASAHPELVRALAVGSTSAHMTPYQQQVFDGWADLARAGDAAGLYMAFGKAIFPAEVFARYTDQLAAAAETVTPEELDRFVILTEAMRGFDITDRLGAIACPVLVLGAKDDAVLGPDAAEDLIARLPGCRSHLYEGYGHAAYDLAPDYKERLAAFFSGKD